MTNSLPYLSSLTQDTLRQWTSHLQPWSKEFRFKADNSLSVDMLQNSSLASSRMVYQSKSMTEMLEYVKSAMEAKLGMETNSQANTGNSLSEGLH